MTVHHVTTLEQALMLWAAARADGHDVPTFTVPAESFALFADAMNHSYTVEVTRDDGKKIRINGIVMYFEPV